jgi:hypothetical protein
MTKKKIVDNFFCDKYRLKNFIIKNYNILTKKIKL